MCGFAALAGGAPSTRCLTTRTRTTTAINMMSNSSSNSNNRVSMNQAASRSGQEAARQALPPSRSRPRLQQLAPQKAQLQQEQQEAQLPQPRPRPRPRASTQSPRRCRAAVGKRWRLSCGCGSMASLWVYPLPTTGAGAAAAAAMVATRGLEQHLQHQRPSRGCAGATSVTCWRTRSCTWTTGGWVDGWHVGWVKGWREERGEDWGRGGLLSAAVGGVVRSKEVLMRRERGCLRCGSGLNIRFCVVNRRPPHFTSYLIHTSRPCMAARRTPLHTHAHTPQAVPHPRYPLIPTHPAVRPLWRGAKGSCWRCAGGGGG